MMVKIIRDDNFNLNLKENANRLFETLLVEEGKCMFLEDHLERFILSIGKIPKEYRDFTYLGFLDKVVNCGQEIEVQDLQEFRELKQCISEYVANACVNPMKEINGNPLGLRITFLRDALVFSFREVALRNRRLVGGSLGIKHIEGGNYLGAYEGKVKITPYEKNLTWKREAGECNFYDFILVNEECKVISSTLGNLIFQKGDICYTPLLNPLMLGGVVRHNLINEGFIKEREINIEEIMDFDFIYVINSLVGVLGLETLILGDKRIKVMNNFEKNDIIKKYRVLEERYLNDH